MSASENHANPDLRATRGTRLSVNRSNIRAMTPRGSLIVTPGAGSGRTGGVIFSNVKAGMACPFFPAVENALSRQMG